jgi:hypothetical protein
MMGERQIDQAALFYKFSLDRHVPADHILRAIDRFADLEGVRTHLASFYSSTGRPSIDPELLIRMLIVGYCFGIRSERRLCEEVFEVCGFNANHTQDSFLVVDVMDALSIAPKAPVAFSTFPALWRKRHWTGR